MTQRQQENEPEEELRVLREEDETQWGEEKDEDAWRKEFRGHWSEQALNAAEAFSARVDNDPALAENFSTQAIADPDFRPTWIQDPEDGTADRLVSAMNSQSAETMEPAERERMADRLAVMMTRNVWGEVGHTEQKPHPEADRVHDILVARMDSAMQGIMRGIVRGEPGTVVSSLIDVVTYDHQARQFNRTGTVPPDLT